MNKLVPLFCLIVGELFAQSYAPAPGQPGSTAIHMDSSIFVDWAASVVVTRGPMNIINPSAGPATYGTEADALGPADGISVFSLGDSGIAVVSFNQPILNGPGPDFAIFENGFIDHYMELAFVEVSSDGLNFFRFDAVSEIPTDNQLTNFSTSNCGYVHNLAGKYRAEYGTPFDLEDLAGTPGLDLNNIQYVRLIDVIGSIDPSIGSYDSQGNIINDPFTTEFESGGFDLEAIGVIHSVLSVKEHQEENVLIYPNPTKGKIFIHYSKEVCYVLRSSDGRIVQEGSSKSIDLSTEETGVYFLEIRLEKEIVYHRVVKD